MFGLSGSVELPARCIAGDAYPKTSACPASWWATHWVDTPSRWPWRSAPSSSRLIRRIQTDGWVQPENQSNPVLGFAESWVQPLLAFNVGFLALLFLVQAWLASRSSGKHEQEDDTALEWLIRPLAGGGPPF